MSAPVSSQIDVSGYPSSAILLSSAVIDYICRPLYFCKDWKDWVGLEYEVSRPKELLPPLVNYGDFCQDMGLEPLNRYSFYRYAFSTTSSSLAEITTPMSICIILVLVIVLRRIKSILLPFFQSVGRKAGRATHGLAWEEKNEIRIIKFGEYVFRLLYHTLISVYGIYFFGPSAPWWQDARLMFLGFPNLPVEPHLAWYYLIQCSYNIDALVSLLELSLEWRPRANGGGSRNNFPIRWSPNVRGDFQEMLIHHIVTNMLIIGSSHFRFTRVGSMVFLIHDISDIPVDLSKLANFLKYKVMTVTCFGLMVVCWMLLRLGVLPWHIYRAVLYDSHLVMETGEIPPVYYVAYKNIFVVLVGAIILLHAMWFWMFLKMGYILVFRGEAHDLSEHKKGEDQGKTITKSGGKKDE